MGIGKALAAAEAPWWWSGVLALGGAWLGIWGSTRIARQADERRSAAEQEQYLRNRLADEVSDLLGAVEAMRLHMLRGMHGVERTEDTKPDRSHQPSWEKMEETFESADDLLRGMFVQVSRVRMYDAFEVAEAAGNLYEAGRRYYMSALFKKQKTFDKAHTRLNQSVADLVTATRRAIGAETRMPKPPTTDEPEDA